MADAKHTPKFGPRRRLGMACEGSGHRYGHWYYRDGAKRGERYGAPDGRKFVCPLCGKTVKLREDKGARRAGLFHILPWHLDDRAAIAKATGGAA